MGFSGTFYVYGAINVVWALITLQMLPKDKENKYEKEQLRE
jgi:hypothetical protein